MTLRRIFLFAAITGACAAQNRDGDFQKLADRYLDEVLYRYDPAQGTAAGFHQYDALMPAQSRAAIADEVAALKRYQTAFQAFDAKSLSEGAAGDRELLIAQVRGSLLSLEDVRGWEKDPDHYSSYVTNAVFVVMARTFAAPAERLKSVIARERAMPALFASARENLKNPPRIYTQISLEQIPGIIGFFRQDVPAAFQGVTDAALMAEFHKSNQTAIDTLTAYQTFLKNDLLPRSNGDFRIGAGNFSRKLLYDEMVDIPLDRLREIGYQDLRRNQAELRRVAATIDPKRDPMEILHDLERDHPAPDKLLQAFRDVLEGMRQFITEHGLVTIPSPVLPIVEETPPFMRALTFASMDTPGPFEKNAKEAFFNVTLPEAAWPLQKVEEHMAGFNYGTVISTAVHEVYPGHYTQFLWLSRAPSKVRKLIGCSTNAEGWAHYSEQMMLDQGYRNGDPRIRLGQLQDALLRNARYIVGLEMHTGRMTYEQGIDFFVKEGFQTRAIGERETKRGTSDPTYLYYTLGKLEILKLREDYARLKGGKFQLKEFHDAFLGQGFPPVRIVRRALLGNDSPVL